jgi:hypothetical protein
VAHATWDINGMGVGNGSTQVAAVGAMKGGTGDSETSEDIKSSGRKAGTVVEQGAAAGEPVVQDMRKHTMSQQTQREQTAPGQDLVHVQQTQEISHFQPHEVRRLQALGVPTHRAWVVDDSSSQSSMWRGGDDQQEAQEPEDHKHRQLTTRHNNSMQPATDVSDYSSSPYIASGTASSNAAGSTSTGHGRDGTCPESEAHEHLPPQSWAAEHAAIERRALARHVGLPSVDVAVALYYARRLLSKCMRGLRAVMLAGQSAARVARSRQEAKQGT